MTTQKATARITSIPLSMQKNYDLIDGKLIRKDPTKKIVAENQPKSGELIVKALEFVSKKRNNTEKLIICAVAVFGLAIATDVTKTIASGIGESMEQQKIEKAERNARLHEEYMADQYQKMVNKKLAEEESKKVYVIQVVGE